VLEPGARRWAALGVHRPEGAQGSIEAGLLGDELIVWTRHGRGHGYAMDVRVPGRWRPLERAPQPLQGIADCCDLVASDVAPGGVEVIALDRHRGQWRALGEGAFAALAVGDDLIFFVHHHSSPAALDRRTGIPLRLPPAPTGPRYGVATAWAGDRLLIWGGVDDDRHYAVDGAAYAVPRPW
jgi:hypothetical protein